MTADATPSPNQPEDTREPAHKPVRALSKSRYMAGVQCPKRLWLQLHQPSCATPPDDKTQFIFNEGHRVGDFARHWRGEGVFIELDWKQIDRAFSETRHALDNGATRIYEAGFEAGQFRAFVDIIERLDDGSWRAIEVKSTSKPKTPHYHDLAFQCWVMAQHGLTVSEAAVVHLDTAAVWPEKARILTCTDRTDEILPLVAQVEAQAAGLLDTAQQATCPSVQPGPQCTSPYLCEFQAFCGYTPPTDPWQALPRVTHGQRRAFAQAGWQTPADIPGQAAGLTPLQRKWLTALHTGTPYIEAAPIRHWFSTLAAPLYSFDFETISYRLPRFDGTSPMEPVPFQFSCHRQDADGTVSQVGDFLHDHPSDPRPALVEAMLACLGQHGSILAWNARFEKRILGLLGRALPEYKPALDALRERFVDPLPLFQQHYLHPDTSGSASLKKVGLALLGEHADYTRLAIQDGNDAFVQWDKWLFHQGDPAIADQLRHYCAMDTLLPLQILHTLQPLVEGSAGT